MTGRPPVSGATQVVGIIGDPIRHSLSPLLYNAAFDALGLDWVYVVFPVAAGNGAAAVDAFRTLGLSGLNVTMPHKADCAARCDELTPDAAALGAVNTVWTGADGQVRGDSTDGEGFLRSLTAAGIEPGAQRVLLLGAGGAARAIARALGRVGADLTVAARRIDAAEACAAVASGGRAIDTVDVAQLDAVVGVATLVVNATPIGMHGEAQPFSSTALHEGQIVVDTVYHPLETPLLAAARAAGADARPGTGMLLHQAALAFEHFTGQPAPLDAMQRALTRHLTV